MAALVKIALLHLVEICFTGQGLARKLQFHRDVLGMSEALKSLLAKLIRRVAEQVAKRLIGRQQWPSGATRAMPMGPYSKAWEKRFAAETQGFLLLGALGDGPERDGEVTALAESIENRDELDFVQAAAAFFVILKNLPVDGFVLGEGAIDFGNDSLLGFLALEKTEAAPKGFLSRIAKAGFEGIVDQDNARAGLFQGSRFDD